MPQNNLVQSITLDAQPDIYSRIMVFVGSTAIITENMFMQMF